MDTIEIPDEAVDAAVPYIEHFLLRRGVHLRGAERRELASYVIGAAAPHVTAQALESAADYLDADAAQSNYPQEELETLAQKDAASWLRARANGAAK